MTAMTSMQRGLFQPRSVYLPRLSLRGLLASSAALVAATIIAVSATGGTYALMSSSIVVNAGTITTGTATLTINNVQDASFGGLDITALLPGRSVVTPTPLTLRNTGSVPLQVTVGTVGSFTGIPELTSKLKFAVLQTATCALLPDGSAFPVSSVFTIAPGAAVPICVQVGLDASAASIVQGQSATFTIPLNGVQVRQ